MFLPAFRNFISDRFDHTPAWVAIITLFIGMGWLRAGVEKVLTGQWWTGQYLTDFVAENDGWLCSEQRLPDSSALNQPNARPNARSSRLGSAAW